MPTLIDRNGLRDDRFVAAASDTPSDHPAGTPALLTLAQWQAGRDGWLALGVPVGVLLAPADDPLALGADVSKLALVAVQFPAFADGRGYSSARLLRERLQYTGELRAVGDVLRDQLFLMARCGFDSFALRDDQEVDECLTAFRDFTEVYQAANDRGPLFARRFAAGAGRAA